MKKLVIVVTLDEENNMQKDIENEYFTGLEVLGVLKILSDDVLNTIKTKSE